MTGVIFIIITVWVYPHTCAFLEGISTLSVCRICMAFHVPLINSLIHDKGSATLHPPSRRTWSSPGERFKSGRAVYTPPPGEMSAGWVSRVHSVLLVKKCSVFITLPQKGVQSLNYYQHGIPSSVQNKYSLTTCCGMFCWPAARQTF